MAATLRHAVYDYESGTRKSAKTWTNFGLVRRLEKTQESF